MCTVFAVVRRGHNILEGDAMETVEVEGGVAADDGTAAADGGAAEPAERQRTPLDVIPEVLWLLTQSPRHKFMFLADMEWYFLPPFRLRQFRVFHKDKAPIAFVSWAHVSDEVEERLKSGATRLKPEDWRSGENLWLIDLCAPFGGGEVILKELREKVFKGQKVKTLQPAPDGSGMAVVEW
jgi:cytolysin-activating lysine-acyltransferase